MRVRGKSSLCSRTCQKASLRFLKIFTDVEVTIIFCQHVPAVHHAMSGVSSLALETPLLPQLNRVCSCGQWRIQGGFLVARKPAMIFFK